jgi:hypothetical protein
MSQLTCPQISRRRYEGYDVFGWIKRPLMRRCLPMKARFPRGLTIAFLLAAALVNWGCDKLKQEEASVAEKPETALPGRPTADFAVTPECGASPLIISFTDLSQGEIDSWLWEFDDGSVSREVNPPSRTYTNIRTYRVKLTVKAGGLEDSKTIPIQVVEPLSPPSNLKTTMVQESAKKCGTPTDPWRYRFTWDPVANATRYQITVAMSWCCDQEDQECTDTLQTQVVNTISTETQLTRCSDCGGGVWQWGVQAGNSECGGLWSKPSELIDLKHRADPMAQLDSLLAAYQELRRAIDLSVEGGRWQELYALTQRARLIRGDLGFVLFQNSTEPFLGRNERSIAEIMKDELKDLITLFVYLPSPHKYRIEITRSADIELSLRDANLDALLYRTGMMRTRMDWILFEKDKQYFLTWKRKDPIIVYGKVGVNEREVCTLDPYYAMLQIAMGKCAELGDNLDVYLEAEEGWRSIKEMLFLEGVPSGQVGRK